MKNNNQIKGIILGIIVGITWGLDSVFMGKIGENAIFSNFTLSPLISAFFHDSFCFLWLAIVLLFSKQLFPVFGLLKTKKGLATALAAIIGAPIGMSAYQMAIKYATVPYASSISIIDPGVNAILSFLILKEKLNRKNILGIAIMLFGSFMISFNPSRNLPETFIKGILFSFLTVLSWALEGVIIAIAMKHIKNEEHIKPTPQQFLCLRYLVSMISYGLVVLPIIKGYPVATQVVTEGVIFYFAGVAILGAITYICWYKAVNLVGAAIGTALNSTSALWAIIFSFILFKAPITLSLAIWGIVIVIGVFIFAFGSIKK